MLRVSRALGERLSARGLRVVSTRTRDVFVPLEQRTAIANDARGDLFVSIHANAAEDATSRGTETFFLALSPSDASAERVAARENEAFGEEAAEIAAVNDPFIALIGDLIATEHLQESSLLAHEIQGELSAASDALARREAGALRRAHRRPDAGGARRDRLRHPRRGGRGEHEERGAAEGDRRGARARDPRLRARPRGAPRRPRHAARPAETP